MPGDEHELDAGAPRGCARAAASRRRARASRSAGLDEERLPVRRVPELREVQQLEPRAHDAGGARAAATPPSASSTTRRRSRVAERRRARRARRPRRRRRATCSTSAATLTRLTPAVVARARRTRARRRGRARARARDAARAARASPRRRASRRRSRRRTRRRAPCRRACRARRGAPPRRRRGRRARTRSRRASATRSLVARPGDEREERDADRGEQSGEEEPARDDVGRARAVRLRRRARRRPASPAPTANAITPGLEMAVVGDDRPARGVVAVREPVLQRDDERALAGDARRARRAPSRRRCGSPRCPGPVRTTSSKTTRISVGAFATTAPFAGTVRTSVACAQAERRQRERAASESDERGSGSPGDSALQEI